MTGLAPWIWWFDITINHNDIVSTAPSTYTFYVVFDGTLISKRTGWKRMVFQSRPIITLYKKKGNRWLLIFNFLGRLIYQECHIYNVINSIHTEASIVHYSISQPNSCISTIWIGQLCNCTRTISCLSFYYISEQELFIICASTAILVKRTLTMNGVESVRDGRDLKYKCNIEWICKTIHLSW